MLNIHSSMTKYIYRTTSSELDVSKVSKYIPNTLIFLTKINISITLPKALLHNMAKPINFIPMQGLRKKDAVSFVPFM